MPTEAYYDPEGKRAIPSHLLQQAIMEGKAYVADSAQYTVVAKDGTTRTVTGADVTGAIHGGEKLLSPLEVAELEKTQEANSLKGQIGAAASMAADVSTAGLSNVALKAAGTDIDAMHRAQESNPISTTVGAVAGLAPMLLSGGAGAGAQAARLAPTAALGRVAATAGGALERAAVKRGVGSGTARVLGVTAEGVTEGAVDTGVRALSEASINDHELTGEQLWAAAGEAGSGALFGGALGAGLGGLISGTKALGGLRMPDATPTAGPGAVMPEVNGLAAKGADKVARWSAKAIGDNDGLVPSAMGLDDVGRRIRKNAHGEKAAEEQFMVKFSKNTDDMIASDRIVRDVYAGDTKARNVAKVVKRGDDTLASAQRFVDDLETSTEDLALLQNVAKYGKRGKRMRAWVKEAKKGGVASEEQAYMDLDNLKRKLQQRSKASAQSSRLSQDPDKRIQLKNEADRAEQLRGKVQRFLEDQDTWGEAAAQQAARNAEGHKAFNLSGDFRKRFELKTGESDLDDWRDKVIVGDRKKVAAFAKDPTNPVNAHDLDQTRRTLDAREGMYQQLLDQGDIPADKLATVKRSLEATQEAKAELAELLQVKEDAGVVRAIQERESSAILGRLPGGGAILGGVAAGPLGVAAGAAIGALSKPSRIIMQMGAIESIGAKKAAVQRQIKRSVSKHLSAAQRPAGPKKQRKRVPAAAAMAIYGQTPEKRRAKFNRRRAAIQRFEANPEHVIAQVQRKLGDLPEVAPQISTVVAQKHTAQMRFLSSKLPQATQPPASFQPQLFAREPTDAEIERFARYSAAVEDPLSVLSDMRNGNLTTEAVEAVREVFPRLYQEMQLTAMEELGKATKPLDYRATLQLSLLLDIPGHPTLDPAFIARSQQRHAERAQRQPAPQPAGGDGVSDSMMALNQTESQRITGA